MKTITSIVLAVCILSTTAFKVPGPAKGPYISPGNSTHPGAAGSFQRFITHRQGNGAALMWTVMDPATLAGFEIERSYDGEYFDVIAAQSCNNSSINRYRDTDVYPGFIHYRIKAYRYDGSIDYSTVSVVHIVKRG